MHYATQLVMKPKGRLIGVFVSLPVNAYHEDDSAAPFSRGRGAFTIAQQMSDDMRYAHDALFNTLAKTAQDAGVDHEFRTLPFESDLQAASEHARYADLAVLRAPDFAHPERDPYGWSSADLVLSPGVPSLLIPSHAPVQPSFQRVIIAWNASREARRAIADAMPILKSASNVSLLIVDAQSQDDGHEVEPGTEIAEYLAHHGVRVGVHFLEGHHKEPGRVVVERARALGAQIVVMGAYGHSQLATIILGSTTHYMVRHCEVPLFLSH